MENILLTVRREVLSDWYLCSFCGCDTCLPENTHNMHTVLEACSPLTSLVVSTKKREIKDGDAIHSIAKEIGTVERSIQFNNEQDT